LVPQRTITFDLNQSCFPTFGRRQSEGQRVSWLLARRAGAFRPSRFTGTRQIEQIASDRYFVTDILLSCAPIFFGYAFPLFDEPIFVITQIGRQVPLRLRMTGDRCWELFWNSQFSALIVIG
jgi:hypothetical protein